ncbi:hypothetical protein MKX01_040907 [Papaver californicum]|nr:hypothetical protein MKX01_040907 [Papaver californicum]
MFCVNCLVTSNLFVGVSFVQVTTADIYLPRRSPRIIEQVQCREEHATEASRKRKGKSVAHDNQKWCRANNYILGRNTSGSIVIGSTDGAGTSTRCNASKLVSQSGIIVPRSTN